MSLQRAIRAERLKIAQGIGRKRHVRKVAWRKCVKFPTTAFPQSSADTRITQSPPCARRGTPQAMESGGMHNPSVMSGRLARSREVVSHHRQNKRSLETAGSVACVKFCKKGLAIALVMFLCSAERRFSAL
jgi:hypothetical protein